MSEFLKAKGIIFDCDGTLLDSIGVWDEMEQMLCDRAGIQKTAYVTGLLATFTLPETAVWFHEKQGVGASNAEVEKAIDDFMMDYYAHRAKPRPGAIQMVTNLYNQGTRLVLASSTPHAHLEEGMRAVGLRDCFLQIVSTDDVGASKRERKIYDHCLGILGTPKEETWGAEDAIYAIRTLKSAGFSALGIKDRDESGTWEELSKEADVAIRSWNELL